jgi:hypothetical protein
MTEIQYSLISFPHRETLSKVFEEYPDDFESTASGIFRRIVPLPCPECGMPMIHNGFNTYRKEHLGETCVGRYLCSACGKSVEEDRSFWDNLKKQFFNILIDISLRLRLSHVSYEEIESVMNLLYPRDKDTIRNMVQCAIKDIQVPPIKDIQVVHYDEQHPKAGRNQKYRLTLIDGVTKQVIAEELCDSKDSDTVEGFFRRNLDTQKPVFLVTDLYRGYSELFKKIFGNNLTHQLCLFHLGALIVRDFPRKTTIKQELVKYKMLNIFYNRDLEIDFLSCLIGEEKVMKQKSNKEYKAWLKEAMHAFRDFVYKLELKRRREKENLKQRSYYDAFNNFNCLLKEIDSFEIAVRNRLLRIKELWPNLTAFYFIYNVPATNNAIENYYSTSLKTHRKNQLEVPGILDQMKLSALKRAGIFGRPEKTLLEAFFMFIPFLDRG